MRRRGRNQHQHRVDPQDARHDRGERDQPSGGHSSAVGARPAIARATSTTTIAWMPYRTQPTAGSEPPATHRDREHQQQLAGRMNATPAMTIPAPGPVPADAQRHFRGAGPRQQVRRPQQVQERCSVSHDRRTDELLPEQGDVGRGSPERGDAEAAEYAGKLAEAPCCPVRGRCAA